MTNNGDYSNGQVLSADAFADFTSNVEITVITSNNGSCQLVSNGSWIGQSQPVSETAPKTFTLTDELLTSAKNGTLTLYVWTATVTDIRVKGTKGE